MDEERKDIDPLLEDYNYQEALNFFKEISESYYPTLIWDDNHVDNNKLPKVDFGKFDQRKKFIDMFENYYGRGISNFIRVNFSYGGLKHDMFIEQNEKKRKYGTNNFLFWNHVNFDEKQAIEYPESDSTYPKPYLSKEDPKSDFTYSKPHLLKENKIGILAKFIKHP